MRVVIAGILLCLSSRAATPPDKKKLPKAPEQSMLDKYLKSASATSDQENVSGQPGSIWSPTARLSDLARDVRAS
jgi:hypothetical protein